MSKRLFVTLAVTGLALLVAAGGYWWTRRVMVFTDSAWPVPAVSSLTRISLISDGKAFDLQARNGGWVLRHSENDELCLARTDKVLDLVDTVRRNRPLQHLGKFSEDDADAYGLDKELWGITFYGRKSWSLYLGGDGWRKGSVYARSTHDGDEVYLVGSVYKKALQVSAGSLCDTGLLGLVPADVARIAVEGPGLGAWEVARTAGGYAFTGQLPDQGPRVSTQAMDFYLHVLTGMQASGRMTTAPDSLPPVHLRISVWRKGAATPEEVLIYNDGDGDSSYICTSTRQPGFMRLEDDRLEKLALSAFDVSERPVLAKPLNGIEGQKITLTRDGLETSFLLGRKAQGWSDLVTGGDVVGLDVITYGLGSMQYERPPIQVQPENARPWLVWSLYGEGGAATLALHFYRDTDLPPGMCWVRVDDKGPWFTVKTRLVDDVLSRVPAPAPVPEAPQKAAAAAAGQNATNATLPANGQ
ncbi:DUF4340 domain-containing protein [Oleidesulfovibrio sp.]|uniref:DUF4340 domain-containing protein n=1 Tax=Oleidesulfovibrio sp. TaxID=2909707 RepID=UPI003A84834F